MIWRKINEICYNSQCKKMWLEDIFKKTKTEAKKDEGIKKSSRKV